MRSMTDRYKKWRMAKKYEDKIRAAARRGARKLDSIEPDWFDQKHIALSHLDLRAASVCIVGQLLQGPGNHSYFSPLSAREEFYREANGGFIEAMVDYDPHYGFSSLDEDWSENLDYDDQYRVLDDEWKKLIRERRARAKEAVAA